MPIKNEKGEVQRWFGTNTDITDRRLAEDALEESAKHKDHFLATLAHELRNPLAPLKNGCSCWRLAADDQGTGDHTQHDGAPIGPHGALVDDLMDLSRISRARSNYRWMKWTSATWWQQHWKAANH